MPGKGKRYTPEFKEQTARKVVDNSLPIAQVARELGVNDTTLGFWVKDYRKRISSQPLPTDMMRRNVTQEFAGEVRGSERADRRQSERGSRRYRPGPVHGARHDAYA